MSALQDAAMWQEPPAPERTRRHQLHAGLRLLARNRLALIGGGISLVFVLIGIAGIVIIGFDRFHDLYLDQTLDSAVILRAPFTSENILGTDALGRDLLARTVAGIGVSIMLALAITALTLILGMVLGTVAAFYGGWIDVVISAVIDVTWGFPIILLAVALSGVFDRGIEVVILSVPLILWAGFARIVRGEGLSLRERDFVKAARAMGVPDWKIILRHFVPNLVAPTIVMGTYYIPVVIVFEGALSFLGLGTQPPTPSLGLMAAEGRQHLLNGDHWVVTIPGISLVLMVIGFNTLGDGLRDILDPRLRGVR